MHCNIYVSEYFLCNILYLYSDTKYNMLYICLQWRDTQFSVCDCIEGNPKHLCPLQKFSTLAKTFIFLCSCLWDSSGMWTWKYISAYSVIYTNEHGRVWVVCLVWKCGMCVAYIVEIPTMRSMWRVLAISRNTHGWKMAHINQVGVSWPKMEPGNMHMHEHFTFIT